MLLQSEELYLLHFAVLEQQTAGGAKEVPLANMRESAVGVLPQLCGEFFKAVVRVIRQDSFYYVFQGAVPQVPQDNQRQALNSAG
jgi:hypothetical protein